MQDIIDGKDDGPVLTPIKKARNPADEHRTSVIEKLNEKNCNQLRSQCKQENLDSKGKKAELVERLAEKSVKQKYGSPKMRESYQTAMSTPVAQPKSLQSSSSKIFKVSIFLHFV